MAKKTKELERLWWDWLGTAERLLSTLHEQTAALTMRQVERIERLQPELDGLMDLMQSIDEQAATAARTLASELECEPSLKGLVAALEKTDGMQLQSIANRVIVAGRNVQRVIDKNKALIENELAYVNGTMTVIANEVTKAEGPYAGKRTQANVLMNQAA